MATDEDERKSSSLDDLSDIGITSSSDGESEADEPQEVEWLATSRAKRSTAGNRMKSMLANEEPAAEDSDLELLFAEDEEDAGFTDEAADDSDVFMDSSSDEEDKEEKADELEGEKELERQAREKRTVERKRKAQEAIPAKFRKKVRIEQPVARPPRPKKKSERTSWLPSASDLPTRASERSTTRMSKQQLHEKMVSDEIKRRKLVERMEKKAKQLEASKKPPMTQAERLAEAAVIERRNAKSLNRWEEAEKQREEERLRKIAALNNRKLDGPVVTFWSGIQELQEGQGKHVGNLVSMEEKPLRKKRVSVAAALAAKEAEAGASTPTTPVEKSGAAAPEPPTVKTEQPDTPTLSSTQPLPPQPPAGPTQPAAPAIAEPGAGAGQAPAPVPTSAPISIPASTPAPAPASAPESAPALSPASAPTPVSVPAPAPMAPPPVPSDARPSSSGVLAAPMLAPPAGVSPPMLGGQMPMLGFPAGAKPFLAAPNTSHTPSPLSMPLSTPAPAPTAPQAVAPTPTAPQAVAPTQTSSIPTPKAAVPPPPLPSAPITPLHIPQANAQQHLASAKAPDTPQEPPASVSDRPAEVKVTRSCIILQNFDDHAIKDKQVQTQILFGRKMTRLASEFSAASLTATHGY
jgi:vacuolar protein sorting-associated protein 72